MRSTDRPYRRFGLPERKGAQRYRKFLDKFLDREVFGDVRPAGAEQGGNRTRLTKNSRAQPLSRSRNARKRGR